MELVIQALRRLLRVFFRRIEVVGAENVPAGVGGVLIAWHPNGLLDPGAHPRPLSRGGSCSARATASSSGRSSGLLLRFLGTEPIYRPAGLRASLDATRPRAGRRTGGASRRWPRRSPAAPSPPSSRRG